MTGDHQCGFRRNRSTTGHIICIGQMLEEKWKYSETMQDLLADFMNGYYFVRREVLCDILIQLGFLMKLVRLIKMCLSERYIRVRVGKHLSDTFPIKNNLKQGDALRPLLFNFVLKRAIRRFQPNQYVLKLNGTHHLLVYADDVNILRGSVHAVKKNTEALVAASKETGLEVIADKTKYIVMSRDHNEG